MRIKEKYYSELCINVLFFVAFGYIFYHSVTVNKNMAFLFFGYIFSGASSVWMLMNKEERKKTIIFIYRDGIISFLFKPIICLILGWVILPLRLIIIFFSGE